MLSMLLFALGVAIALFLVTYFLTNRYINDKYLSEQNRVRRIDIYKEELQKYVTDNGLDCDDIEEISEWSKDNKYVYVLIYKDDKLLFESGKNNYENGDEMGENKENADDVQDNSVENGTGNSSAEGTQSNPKDSSSAVYDVKNGYLNTGITVRPPSREELFAEANLRGKHPIVASDGVLLVSMVEYTEYIYYDIFNILSFFLGCSGFVLVMWLYFYDITKRIRTLGKEVTAVAEGDLNKKITTDGEDEFTKLCTDVEYMRSSMLDNIEKERAALESNRELITAMSHDIRTPLTVLLGYLDIMKLNAPDGDMQQYIDASERTALRLKKMSDDMFNYFLAYGGGFEIEIEESDARTLIDQMLSGYVFLLREQGYTINFNFEVEDNDFLGEIIVVTDPPQLMRIVENLFSNLMKYADKEKPITLFVDANSTEMTIKVSNYIGLNPDAAQKNGVGLRSCLKLANAMDIRFCSGEKDGIFTSELNIPIVPDLSQEPKTEAEERGGISAWLTSVLEKMSSWFQKAWSRFRAFAKRKD